MGLYENRILPYLVHLSMRQETLSAYRRRGVPSAQGRVLEIGIGSVTASHRAQWAPSE